MSVETLADRLPPYALDIGRNLKALAAETVLSEQQKWGAFIASAYALGVAEVIGDLSDGCPLAEAAFTAAKSAAAITAMTNVYYRSMHLLKNREYAALPVKLRMNVLGDPGVAKNDYELWCVAVSAINGCGLCLDSHEGELRKRGVGAPVVQAAIRIAAVVNAASRVLAAEAAAAARAETSD